MKKVLLLILFISSSYFGYSQCGPVNLQFHKVMADSTGAQRFPVISCTFNMGDSLEFELNGNPINLSSQFITVINSTYFFAPYGPYLEQMGSIFCGELILRARIHCFGGGTTNWDSISFSIRPDTIFPIPSVLGYFTNGIPFMAPSCADAFTGTGKSWLFKHFLGYFPLGVSFRGNLSVGPTFWEMGSWLPDLGRHPYFLASDTSGVAINDMTYTSMYIQSWSNNDILQFETYSKNPVDSSDLGTLRVDVNNGNGWQNGIYTYHGEADLPITHNVPLNQYRTGDTTTFQFRFVFDQTTANSYKNHKFGLSAIYVSDSSIFEFSTPPEIKFLNGVPFTYFPGSSLKGINVAYRVPKGGTPKDATDVWYIRESYQKVPGSILDTTNEDLLFHPHCYGMTRDPDPVLPVFDSINYSGFWISAHEDLNSTCKREYPEKHHSILIEELPSRKLTTVGSYVYAQQLPLLIMDPQTTGIYFKQILNPPRPNVPQVCPNQSPDTNWIRPGFVDTLYWPLVPPSNMDVEVRRHRYSAVWVPYSGVHEAALEVVNYSGQTVSNLDLIVLKPDHFDLVPTNQYYTDLGDSLLVHLTNVVRAPRKLIKFDLITDSTATPLPQMRDTVHLIAYFHPPAFDTVASNNRVDCPIEIGLPYDPNDKVATPHGRTRTKPQKLEYRIRFQNVGNAPAVNVVIVDTLAPELSAGDFGYTEASHPFDLSIENGVATWTFRNINLPDSASDPSGSIGHLFYEIDLPQAMDVGDSIANRAFIYFDQNPPIITNWAYTVVVDKNLGFDESGLLHELFEYYPNPADQTVTLHSERYEGRIELTDLMGRIVRKVEIQPGETYRMDISDLSPGLYLIKTKHESAGKLIIE